jgi:hypothetical protein
LAIGRIAELHSAGALKFESADTSHPMRILNARYRSAVRDNSAQQTDAFALIESLSFIILQSNPDR